MVVANNKSSDNDQKVVPFVFILITLGHLLRTSLCPCFYNYLFYRLQSYDLFREISYLTILISMVIVLMPSQQPESYTAEIQSSFIFKSSFSARRVANDDLRLNVKFQS